MKTRTKAELWPVLSKVFDIPGILNSIALHSACKSVTIIVDKKEALICEVSTCAAKLKQTAPIPLRQEHVR
jgi:hypothetical protein